MSVVAGMQPGVLRLPAAPLLEAIDEARTARQLGLRRLLSGGHLRAYRLAKAEGTVTRYMVGRLFAAIDLCPEDWYGDALQGAPAPRGVPLRPSTVKLPAGPLIDAIEERLRRLAEQSMLLTDPGSARGEAIRVVFGGDTTLERAFYRARQRGWMRLRAAEQLCDAFGWHSHEIWGDAYDRAAFAGTPAGFDPWEGVA
jgi:hypothetical protein